MSANRGANSDRPVPASTISILRPRSRPLSLLCALALGIAPALLLPANAPARRQRAGATGTTSSGSTGEQGSTSTPSGEASAPPASGEGAPPSGEASAGGGASTSSSGESPPAPPSGSGPASGGAPPARSGRDRPADGERHLTRKGSCAVAIEVAPRHLIAGETATISGSLTCASSAQASEQTVTIYQHLTGAPGFSALGTLAPEASGAFRFTSEPLEANGVFYASVQGARSRRVSVSVAPLVTISGPPADAQLSIPSRRDARGARLASNTVTITGAVSPVRAGAMVMLQREGAIEGNWQRIAVGEVGADGRYSLTHSFGIPGTASVRVVVQGHGLPGVSEPLTYQIARRQNPRLTIEASALPLTYGQSLTLSGLAAADESLTLLASSDGGAFAPVASTTSNTDGSYVFPEQSPLRDTRYRVGDAQTSSTTLLAGVRPLLSLQALPASVQSGEAVEFAGAVTPARAGQLVELQRRDGDGLGFHVVETGAVEADGEFSIEHTLSGAGTQTFRVIVPGEGETPAAASPLEQIQVLANAQDAPLEAQAPAASPGEAQ